MGGPLPTVVRHHRGGAYPSSYLFPGPGRWGGGGEALERPAWPKTPPRGPQGAQCDFQDCPRWAKLHHDCPPPQRLQ
eukprot:9469755-Pyramimonas_sp.AAC.1